MKDYFIVPNKDATGWFLKVENTAPIEMYDKKDKAITAGEEMAQNNKPSSLSVLSDDHNVEEKRTYTS